MGLAEKIIGQHPSSIATKAYRWGIKKIRGIIEELRAKRGIFEVAPRELPRLVKDERLSPEDAAKRVMDGIIEFAGIGEELISEVNDNFQHEISALLEDADRIAAGRFKILGKKIDYSSGIRWNYDPANDHEFNSKVLFSKIVLVNPKGGYDIKYPWELSRLQHFPRLAIAYRTTGDEKYLSALIDQTDDWIRNNPVGFGPNWSCTMDVSIRAANIAYAYGLLGKNLTDPAFQVRLVCNLIAHGRFIKEHLEWSEKLTSNHYLADIAGLGVLGCLLSSVVNEGESWRDFARDELESEIVKQVYQNGWDFEASTAYHRLALECFLISAIFMERAWIQMSRNYKSRLFKMSGFVRDITIPDGSFPLIGDNDSGLFMSLQPRDVGNLNYIQALAASYLKVASLKTTSLTPAVDIFWLLGQQGMYEFQALELKQRPIITKYKEGGLWCLRSGDEMDLLTFRLGSVGQNGNGGHAHNDQLSVTIWFDGKPVVVDPGTAVYTSDPVKRNLYRSTKSHATISIGEEEQNRFQKGNLFTLEQETVTGPVKLETGLDYLKIEGSMVGYGPWSDGIRFRRNIRHDLEQRRFEIDDNVELSGDVKVKDLQWNFPLAPGLSVEECETGFVIRDDEDVTVANLEFGSGWDVRVDDTNYAPEYGVEIPNITLRFTSTKGSCDAKFIFSAPVRDQTEKFEQ